MDNQRDAIRVYLLQNYVNQFYAWWIETSNIQNPTNLEYNNPSIEINKAFSLQNSTQAVSNFYTFSVSNFDIFVLLLPPGEV